VRDLTPASGDERAPTDRSYWVVPGRLIAGAYPGRADRAGSRSPLELLLEAGVRAFVNLTENTDPYSGDAHLDDYEGDAMAVQRGVRVLRRPIVDDLVPSRGEMMGTLDDIDALLEKAVPIYVHCWGGLGRTGTVVGCWLIRHELASRDDVLHTLSRLRRQDRRGGRYRSPQNELQEQFVFDWQPGR
jgi:protein-tyrosine phosphatase